jgi:hypothetical protein
MPISERSNPIPLENITGYWDDLEAELQLRITRTDMLCKKCDDFMKRNKEKRESEKEE